MKWIRNADAEVIFMFMAKICLFIFFFVFKLEQFEMSSNFALAFNFAASVHPNGLGHYIGSNFFILNTKKGINDNIFVMNLMNLRILFL